MSDPTTSGQPAAPTQDQLLGATTPEALAALMAQANGAPQPQGVADPAPAAADAAPAPAAEPASASPGASSSVDTDPPVIGVATKSGKGVLPFTVLQQERQERQHWRNTALDLQTRLEQTTAELERMRNAGASQQQQADALADLSDEEISAAEADFPLVAKMARAMKAQAAAPAPAPAPARQAPTQDDQDDTAAAVHSAIASLPLLSQWQQRGGVVWQRAVELDNQMQADPRFQGRSLAERFAAVQQHLAGELGVQVPSTAPAPAPATGAAPAPQPEPFRPNTLSDLQGGARTQHDPINEDADGMALARRFATMTPDQMAAAIRRAAS